MNMFKNFEDFKSRADNEYLNDLFYFFKGHVQDKEWDPRTEVTFYGLNGELEEGFTLTLGEARDFLREKYSKAKTEEVANSFAERVKSVEAWKPEQKGFGSWAPTVEKSSEYSSDSELDIEIDRDVIDDEEYEEIYNNKDDEELEEIEETFEDFIEDFLGDDEDADDKALDPKDKKKKKQKVKVLGEELPFEDNGDNNRQKEVAIEAEISELARERAEQRVQIEVIEEDFVEQNSYGYKDVEKVSKTMEEAFNETIAKMGNDLNDIEQYDEHGQVISQEIIVDKMLSNDENAENAFKGVGTAGDASIFGQVFKDFTSQMGDSSASHARTESNINDIINGLVMGMAFTGSGEEIRESAPEPIVTPVPSSSEYVRGVHETFDGKNLGVESGFNVDDYGNLKSAAQERYEAEKRDNYGIGQDTRDIQKLVDASVADKDARDAIRVQSYGQEIVTMPESTMVHGAEFNRIYNENFSGVTSVEFTSVNVPENVKTVDFSVQGNGAVIGFEENGVLYITAASPAGSDLSMVTEPQVYLNPDSAGMFKDAVHLQSVSFGNNVADTSYVHNMGGMFINCENLISVNADNLNTERLQNIDGMFANCSNLETFNNEGWRTNNIITASFAFSECHSLTQDPSANWHMENLRYADGFMSGCINVTGIDMSGWNARNLLSTREMFNGCSSAEYININGLQTVNVKDMAGMFKGCENLEDINLTKLNTSSLSPVVEGKGGADIGYQRDASHPIDDIFYGCTKLLENEGFKDQAILWEASANRAVELNSPVYMESKPRPTSYEQLSIPVTTEIQNRDGTTSQFTSYYNQDGSTTFIIPSASHQSLSVYEKMTESQTYGHQQAENASVSVFSKPNNDGTTSIITSQTYSDHSKTIQTQTIGVDGQVIAGNIISYDKYGAQINELPLSRLEDFAKAQPLFVNSKLNEDGTISISTTKTYADNSKVVKTETFAKDGSVVKEDIASFDSYGIKMTEVPAQKVEDFALATGATMLTVVNKDGTASVVTSKTYADNSHVVKSEMVNKEGNILRENVVSFDSNGNQMFYVPFEKMQDIQESALKVSSVKVNMDGTLSVAVVKTLSDNAKIVNAETFNQHGVVKSEFALYDKNETLIQNIPSSKLADIMVSSSGANIELKINENNAVTMLTTKTFGDGSKIVNAEVFAKQGGIHNELAAYDKNGIQISNISDLKLNELMHVNERSNIVLKTAENGAASIVSTKIFEDGSKITKTETLNKDGYVSASSFNAYDKNGIKFDNIPDSKLNELMLSAGSNVVLRSNENSSVSIVSTKIFEDGSKITKTETLNKDGYVSASSFNAYDKNGIKFDNIPDSKLNELMLSAGSNVVLRSNENSSVSIVSTKMFEDGAKIIKIENLNKEGHVSDNVFNVYDKNGAQIVNIPSEKIEILMKANPAVVSFKASKDGVSSVTITKSYNDGSKIVNTESFTQQGVSKSELIAYDKSGIQISNVSAAKLEELIKTSPENVAFKMNKDGTASIIETKAFGNNSQIVKRENIGKDGSVIKNEIVAYDKNGTLINNISEAKLGELTKLSSEKSAHISLVANADGSAAIMTTQMLSANAKVVRTEIIGNNGVLIGGNITAYDSKGTRISNIPESKLEEILKISATNASNINLVAGNDGNTSIVTTKTFIDSSKVVKLEEFAKNGDLVKNTITGYDKNNIELEKIPPAKLEEILKSSGNNSSLKIEKDGNQAVVTTKTLDNNIQIIKTESFNKNGNITKDTLEIYDKNGIKISNIPAAKIEELLKSDANTIEVKKNDDGTLSIVSTKLTAEESKVIKTELISKEGNVIKDEIAAFDKNGARISNLPVNKLEEALKTGAVLVTTKINKDGEASIVTERVYADKTKIVQTEIIKKDGTILKDVVAYDKNGKKLSDISKDRLTELASLKKLEINPKSDGHQIVMTLPKSDGTKAVTTINVKNNGNHTSNTVIHGKDGSTKPVHAPVLTKGQSEKIGTLSVTENSNKKRRESKGKDGHAFGTSKSSKERRIYDSAKLKRDQNIYKSGKIVEEFGKGAKPVFAALGQAISKLTDNPYDDSLAAETAKEFNKARRVSKDVVSGIFGVSIAAALKTEQIDFNKTMKAAQITKGLEKSEFNLSMLQGKSQKETIEALSNIKDANGKQLLSDKQIRNIAKHREGVIDAVNFRNAVENAKASDLFKRLDKDNKSLSTKQRKALEKFNAGRLDKLSTKDISLIADAYFARATNSQLYGVKISSLSKKRLDAIIAGKDPVIDFKKLSAEEKSMLKTVRKAGSLSQKKKEAKSNGALKRLKPLSLAKSAVTKVMQKTGSGIAQDSINLISNVVGKGRMVYSGAYTAIQVASIYANLGLRGVKFGASGLKSGAKAARNLMAKTKPGSIIIKYENQTVKAFGESALGKKIKEDKKLKAERKTARAEKKQMKQNKKFEKKEKRREKIKAGAKKASDRFQRTAAGKAAAAAAGKAKMIAESKVGKAVGAVGKVISAPFKGLRWVGNKINVIGTAIRDAISKLMLYAAAGLAGIIILLMILVMIVSAITGGGSAITTASLSIMAPPSYDENGDDLNLTDAEYAERWSDFKDLIQEKYQDSKDFQDDIIEGVVDLSGEIPNIEGQPIYGWANEQIMEYGVLDDIAETENDGYWITYRPFADDNGKDAIALAYVIMGAKDFYYEESKRDKLIEDLIALLNPEIEETDIINTVYPGSTYADEDKKIYACLTGCGTLTYYCADLDAYIRFSKTGCEGTSANYEYIGRDEKYVKDLEDCVRLSTDGTAIMANGDKIPEVDKPVIYTDNLISHKYGDSYISTCTGEEEVTIKYKYNYMTNELRPTTDVRKYMDYKGYYYWEAGVKNYYTYASSVNCSNGINCGGCDTEHYHFYDEDGNFAGYVKKAEMKAPTSVQKTSSVRSKTVTLEDLGYSHGISPERTGGIDSSDQVTGPTRTITIPTSVLENYIEDNVLSRGQTINMAELSEPVSSECESWTVEFFCKGHDVDGNNIDGHEIKICENGHTDLAVKIVQYSVENFTCFGGSNLALPRDRAYKSYIDDFLALEDEERQAALKRVQTIVESDWYALYGVVDENELSVAENSKIGEAYIYNYLVSNPEETRNGLGLGMSKANAAAFLAYMKVASDFQINTKNGDYYGLCLWDDKELEEIGRNARDNHATMLEQLTLLKTEYSNVSLNCGFKTANDLVEFRRCEDSVEGAKEAARILIEKWEYGNATDTGAIEDIAGEYFNRMTGSDPEFDNPNLQTICNYVSWALEIAASPEHGYCQSRWEYGSMSDYDCGSFVNAALSTVGFASYQDQRFEEISIETGIQVEDLQFGDIIFDRREGDEINAHVEIYIGNGCSVGARGPDGGFGCSERDPRWEKHPSSWEDHIFHKAGDQGIGWKEGAYTYNEIAASAPSSFNKYKDIYRLKPTT